MTSVDQLFAVNILSGLSIIVSSIPLIIGAGISAYYDENYQQLLISALDAIIVTVMMMIFSIC